jgi:hypothetical protein
VEYHIRDTKRRNGKLTERELWSSTLGIHGGRQLGFAVRPKSIDPGDPNNAFARRDAHMKALIDLGYVQRRASSIWYTLRGLKRISTSGICCERAFV